MSSFASPKLLIGRARTHILDLNAAITAFFNTRPHSTAIYPDNDAKQTVYAIRLTAQLPESLTVIAKDAAGNLRDALDHAVYACACDLAGGEPKNTGFPFAKNAAGVRGELNGDRLRGNPPAIRPLLEGFCPHEGGNDLLWGLNSIRNPNTHRILVPVGQAITHQSLGIESATITGNSQIGYSRWNAAKNEVEYMRLGFGSNAKFNVQAAFTVSFEGVNALSGKPVIPVLNAIGSEVERVVLAIEAETNRLLAEGQNAHGAPPAAEAG